MTTTTMQELKFRADAKRKHLEARLHELQADATKSKSEAVDTIKQKMRDLDQAAREGWDNLTDATRKKVNEILK